MTFASPSCSHCLPTSNILMFKSRPKQRLPQCSLDHWGRRHRPLGLQGQTQGSYSQIKHWVHSTMWITALASSIPLGQNSLEQIFKWRNGWFFSNLPQYQERTWEHFVFCHGRCGLVNTSHTSPSSCSRSNYVRATQPPLSSTCGRGEQWSKIYQELFIPSSPWCSGLRPAPQPWKHVPSSHLPFLPSGCS